MKSKILLKACFALLCTITANISFAQTTPAFVQQEDIRVAGKLTDAQLYPATVSEKSVTRTYFDGLGRPIQVVGVGASPSQADLIQPIAYDIRGRQDKNYLPYAAPNSSTFNSYRANALGGDQSAFYNNGLADKIADDSSPFSQQLFENSPLERVYAVGNIGAAFNPLSGTHYKTLNYRSNSTAADGAILKFDPTGTNTGNYDDFSLNIYEALDEDGHKLMVFKNATEQVVLKREYANTTVNGVAVTYFDTYYVYNNAGLIAYVIPPKATSLIKTGSTITSAAVTSLIFKFVYDTQGRVAEKTVPGAGLIYIVYDPLDRPVLLQNAKLKTGNKWNYIKYDIKGRAIAQGIYVNTAATQAAMQTIVDAVDYSVNWYESRSSSTTWGNYTNNCFPTASITPLAYSFFDDYDLNLDGTADFNYSQISGAAPAITTTKGLLTIIKTRTSGSGISPAVWLTKLSFYDKYYHLIQVRNNNQIYSTIGDNKTIFYNFVGKVVKTRVTKSIASGNSTVVISNYNYDHGDRLTSVDQQYNSLPVVRVAGYSYNEIGQLIDKQIHSTNSGSNWLQSVDYRYDIRGRMTTINNSKLAVDNGAGSGYTNDDSNDVFGMEILYDRVDANLTNTASYNGNISAVKWMSLNNSGVKTYERSYKYSYDLLNRFTGANYAERSTTGTGIFNNNLNGFDESGISYDENGNILKLKRNSSTQGANSYTVVDDLTYSYDANNANKLISVTDGGTTSNYTGYGFKNPTGTTNTYAYDTGGNLTTDPYKGLTIAYNDLNRTDKITFSSSANKYIDYSYDADGTLLRKRVYDDVGGVATLKSTTDYIDGFVYLDGVLSYFKTLDGRVRNAAGTLISEYSITDQQGNARVTFDNSGSGGSLAVIQENSYYAFGLQLANSPVGTPTVPKKELYNGGSEWQNDFSNLPDYYQTYYRNYDPALGRFVAADPMAEAAESLTVYAYANNNPILFNDPLGDLAPKLQEIVDKILFESDGHGGNFNFTTGVFTYFTEEDTQTIIRGGGKPDPGSMYSGFVAPGNHVAFDAQGRLVVVTNSVQVTRTNGQLDVTYTEKTTIIDNSKYRANQGEAGYVPAGGTTGNWYDLGSKANAVWGAMTPFLKSSIGYVKNGAAYLKYYASGWKGGSRALIRTVETARVAGWAGFAAGEIMDIAAYLSSDPEIHISGTKALVNLGFGLLGNLGGEYGTAASAIYFGVDAFYPGGWSGVGKDLSDFGQQIHDTTMQGLGQFNNIYQWVPHQ